MSARARRPSLAALLSALVPLLVCALGAQPAGAAQGASLASIEDQYMCVSCHEPLDVAQSPQALSERRFLGGLVAQGLSPAQIQSQMVAQYGPGVLGRPPAQGFNLTVYILPPALLAAGIVMLALALPRWRRRARDDAAAATATGAGGDHSTALSPEASSRVAQELAAFDR